MKVYIKDRKRRKDEFQFFMHDFVDACKREGLAFKPDLLPSYKWHYRALLRDVLFAIYKIIKRIFPFLINRNEGLIIAASGMTIKDISFPYFGRYEIIPYLWDTWPYSWERMKNSFVDLDIKLAFVSSKQVAEMINEQFAIRAIWVPEGVETSHYDKGQLLKDRINDVFEMGRRHNKYHEILIDLYKESRISGFKTSNLLDNGRLNGKDVKYTNNELYRLMSNTKIMVCFPRCDTNKSIAGNIETLTQRYWEAMLSRCLIIGRAPEELINMCGYNPVIEVTWDNPKSQLLAILNNIEMYQDLVDRNYKYAINNADWKYRISDIVDIINQNEFI